MGDYDVIVAEDNGYVWAEDRYGVPVKEGSADEVLQGAVDYVADIGGGRIYVKSGSYLFNNKVTLKDLTSIILNNNAVIIPNKTDVIFTNDYGSEMIHIKGGFIGGKDPYPGVLSEKYECVGIDLNFSKNTFIENITFSGLLKGAIKLKTAWDALIFNCKFFNCGNGDSGYYSLSLEQDPTIGDNTNSCKFIGCRFENHYIQSTYVNLQAPSRQIFFDTCKFHGYENNTYPLIYIHGDNWNRNSFVNCIFEWNGAPLVKVQDSTSKPTMFNSCIFQSWGYYDSGKPYSNLIEIEHGFVKIDSCVFIGGDNAIYATYNTNGISKLWLNSIYINNSVTSGINIDSSDVYGNYINILNCGKYGIQILPKYHSKLNNITCINTDLARLSTPAIWVKGANLVDLTDVYVTLTDVGYQFDVKPVNVSNIIIGNKKSENHGTATFTADGTTTSFTITHNLIDTPEFVSVNPKAGAPKPSSVTADSTYITVTFDTAPAAGTYYYWWDARAF